MQRLEPACACSRCMEPARASPFLATHAPQVDAPRVRIAPSWQPVLAGILGAAAEALGLGDAKAVNSRLYQLLLYEQVGVRLVWFSFVWLALA